MAMFLAFLTAFGSIPINVFAGERLQGYSDPGFMAEPFMATIAGEEVLVSADGIAMVEVEGFEGLVPLEIPRYVHLDGERIYIDDERIASISPVIVPESTFAAFRTEVSQAPNLGVIVAFSATPVPEEIVRIGAGGNTVYHQTAYIQIDGQRISALRYVVLINGIEYEAFCADPGLPGPETNASVYVLLNDNAPQFRNILRYGVPINPYLTGVSGRDNDFVMWAAYMTRVAIAFASLDGGRITSGGTQLGDYEPCKCVLIPERLSMIQSKQAIPALL